MPVLHMTEPPDATLVFTVSNCPSALDTHYTPGGRVVFFLGQAVVVPIIGPRNSLTGRVKKIK